MEIIDINNKKRSIKEFKINSKYADYVEVLFDDKHIEWYPLNDFRKNNPEIDL